MLNVDLIDTNSKSQVDSFVEFHYNLYRPCPQWVPPFYSDIKLILNRKKHPVYEHSDADFFVASKDGEVVGRLAVVENKPFNKYHGTHQATFSLFDSIDDPEVSKALFEKAFEWARARGLDRMVGPKGFGAFDGYGILVEGFQYRQMMTMAPYNYAYYQKLIENLGFEKEVDFVSCYIDPKLFKLPEKAKEIAQKVREKGSFKTKSFRNKRELISWAGRIGEAYNKTFVNNWEYYPLTPREIKGLVDTLVIIADPKLIQLIIYNDEIVGFILAFPDLSSALQRAKGHITPWAIVDIMLEMKRTNWVSLNGVGVLPEYQGRGGNALMYDEMEKTFRDYKFENAEQTMMADTAVQVRKDMITLGAKIYKVHRVFHRDL
jgi:GNAT superfamily N-acetyltransferase